MGSFHSIELVEKVKESGVYPRIHNTVFEAYTKVLGNFIDLWACYNLIGHRIVTAYDNVVGVSVEPNRSYFDKRLTHPRLTDMEVEMSSDYLNEIIHAIKRHNITTVVARRVFPEIEETEPGMVAKLNDAFFEAWISTIILEGRIYYGNRKPRTNLYNYQKEVDMFTNYHPVETLRNTVILLRND